MKLYEYKYKYMSKLIDMKYSSKLSGSNQAIVDVLIKNLKRLRKPTVPYMVTLLNQFLDKDEVDSELRELLLEMVRDIGKIE